MEIQGWWADDADERYWMEITDRGDIGADLFAPQTDQSGRPYWGYELVTWVRPGDVVFHWHKSMYERPSVVGWSTASGVVEETTIEWQARGTVGRARGNLRSRPAWRMELLDYTPLLAPVDEAAVRRAEPQLRADQAALATELKLSKVPYFPFAFSDKRPVRTSKTYFVKLPKRLLVTLGLDGIVPQPEALGSTPSKPKTRRRKGAGYISDPQVRSAIEWRAVELAVDYYERPGVDVQYVGGSESYDLTATTAGVERRIEVKGTSGYADAVELTSGEVKNGKRHARVDLFVVDQVQWERLPDGSVRAWGGEARVWEDWTPTDGRLTPTRYRYKLDLSSGRSV